MAIVSRILKKSFVNMALKSSAICNRKMDFVPVFTKPPTQPTSLYFSKMKIRSFSSSSFEDLSSLLNKQVELMTDSTNIEKVTEGMNMMVTLGGTTFVVVGVVSLGTMLLAREAASKSKDQQMEPVLTDKQVKLTNVRDFFKSFERGELSDNFKYAVFDHLVFSIGIIKPELKLVCLYIMLGKLIVVVFDVFGREVVRTKAAIEAVLEPIEKHYLDEDDVATASKIVVGDRAVHVQVSGVLDQPKPSVEVIGYVLMLNGKEIAGNEAPPVKLPIPPMSYNGSKAKAILSGGELHVWLPLMENKEGDFAFEINVGDD